MTTLNIGSSTLPVFEELVNSVESNPGSEGESKKHNHNSAANRYEGNKVPLVRERTSVNVSEVSFVCSRLCHVPSNVGKPRHKTHDRNLEHDGGGVDGDVDEGGEDQLVVAGLEAVYHEGAEHDREDGLKSGAPTPFPNDIVINDITNVKQLKYHLS